MRPTGWTFSGSYHNTDLSGMHSYQTEHTCSTDYHMAGNFGGNLFWRIAEISVFGGIYFGGLAKSLCHNDIHSKMANPVEQY